MRREPETQTRNGSAADSPSRRVRSARSAVWFVVACVAALGLQADVSGARAQDEVLPFEDEVLPYDDEVLPYDDEVLPFEDEEGSQGGEGGAADSGVNRGADLNDKDPIQPLNRAFYGFNKGVDSVLLEPAANAWDAVVPKPVDGALARFISNLSLPFTALNAFLQGDVRGSGITLARFGLNSTVGMLGFADPASTIGLPECSEDLGQTLGVWGMGNGPYLVLPLLGPSGLRDAASGLVESSARSAKSQQLWEGFGLSDDGVSAVRWSLVVVEVLQLRIELREAIDYVEATALDEYTFVRTFYRQNRERSVKLLCSDIFDQNRERHKNNPSFLR